MSDIEFEADNMDFRRPGSSSPAGGFSGSNNNQYAAPAKGGMIGWLMRHGLVKSENTGQYMLIGFVVFNIVVAVAVLKYFSVI